MNTLLDPVGSSRYKIPGTNGGEVAYSAGMALYGRALYLLFLVFALTGVARAETGALTAEAIMARVAANQDRAEVERMHYVYMQHIRMVSRRGGRVMCEEVTDTRIAPEQSGSHKELVSLNGRYWEKKQYVAYTQLPKAHVDDVGLDDMDRDLVENLRNNLTDDSSKDGLAKGLFPLTSKAQTQYQFTLVGQQAMNGRQTFHIRFEPKDRSDYDWKGEAFIDVTEFEPVVVLTKLSRKVPLAVRTLLGTNVPGLGFTVTYARQPDGVWFPATFGTEFRMRVLFLIARDITMAMDNNHFEKTHSSARILEGVTAVPQP